MYTQQGRSFRLQASSVTPRVPRGDVVGKTLHSGALASWQHPGRPRDGLETTAHFSGAKREREDLQVGCWGACGPQTIQPHQDTKQNKALDFTLGVAQGTGKNNTYSPESPEGDST